MKLKLKASARMNRRYILVEAENKDEIEKAILDYIGILGWVKDAVEISENKGRFIVAVNREQLGNVRAALSVSGKKIKIINVSGTIKGLIRNL